MNVALIGYGLWGRNLARVLARRGWLAAVVDVDNDAVCESRRAFPQAQVGTCLDALAWESVDAVVIATPPQFHAEQALIALECGKDVFSEKPLAMNKEDVRRLAALADERGLILMTGHILDYHPAVVELLRHCTTGDVGELRRIETVRTRLIPRSPHVSVVYELLWHDIALVSRLIDRPLQAVSADAMVDPSSEAKFDAETDGIRVSIGGSLTQPYRQSRVIVTGSEATLVFDDERDWPEKLQRFGREETHEAVAVAATEPLAAELAHFAECVRTRTAPRSDAAVAMETLAMAETLESSCLLPQ